MAIIINRLVLSLAISWALILQAPAAESMNSDKYRLSDLGWKLSTVWMEECGAPKEMYKDDRDVQIVVNAFRGYDNLEKLYSVTSWMKQTGAMRKCSTCMDVSSVLYALQKYDPVRLQEITSWMKEFWVWDLCTNNSSFTTTLSCIGYYDPRKLEVVSFWMKDSGARDKFRSINQIWDILSLFDSYFFIQRGISSVNRAGLRNETLLKLLLTEYSLNKFNPAQEILTPAAHNLPNEYEAIPLYIACLGTSYEDQRIKKLIEAKIADPIEREKIREIMISVLGETHPSVKQYFQEKLPTPSP